MDSLELNEDEANNFDKIPLALERSCAYAHNLDRKEERRRRPKGTQQLKVWQQTSIRFMRASSETSVEESQTSIRFMWVCVEESQDP